MEKLFFLTIYLEVNDYYSISLQWVTTKAFVMNASFILKFFLLWRFAGKYASVHGRIMSWKYYQESKLWFGSAAEVLWQCQERSKTRKHNCRRTKSFSCFVKIDVHSTSTIGHLSTTAPLFGGHSIHWLLFKPLYKGHLFLSQRSPLRTGSTVYCTPVKDYCGWTVTQQFKGRRSRDFTIWAYPNRLAHTIILWWHVSFNVIYMHFIDDLER